jgi:predicted dehydrogenase
VQLRIGIIGAGRMGTTHGKSIHYLAKHGLVDAAITGVCDSDPERLASFVAASGATLATAEPEALIESPDINTIYICTPTYNHRELAERVCAAGKALFCEKPLAFNAVDAQVMHEAATRAGITHQVGLVMRFSAVMNVLRSLVQDAEFGRPMTASMVDDQFFPIQGHYASTWRGDVAQAGAGTLLEHAIHDMDLLVSFFGPVRRVHGTMRDFSQHAAIEDMTAAMLEFESGAVVTHASIWHNILHRGSSRRITITSANAQFGFDDSDWCGPIRIDAQRDGRRVTMDADEVVKRHIEVMGVADERLRPLMTSQYTGQDYLYENYAFLRAAMEHRPAFPAFDVAVYAHRVVDAIYESARRGSPVDLEN